MRAAKEGLQNPPYLTLPSTRNPRPWHHGSIPLGLGPLPKKTRKEVFLDEMNQLVLRTTLMAPIAPFVPGCAPGFGWASTLSHRDHAAHLLPAALVEPDPQAV